MNHWIIFIVGLIVAIIIWILLSRHLFSDDTSAQDNKDDNKWEECTDEDVLREAVRLAELKIEEFSNSIKIIDYKAMALITLCISMMGYFSSIEWLHNLFELLRVVALFFLLLSALEGASVTNLRYIGIAGINPKASLWRAKYHQSNDNTDDYDRENKKPDIPKLLLYTLGEYHEVIEATKKAKDEKRASLKDAIRFLLIGISTLGGWIVAKGFIFLMTSLP